MENQNTNNHKHEIYEEGISLKELFTIVWNWKWILIIITVAGLVIGGVAGYVTNNSQGKATTVIEFQWDGVSKGEYPDGQRFDYGSAFDAPIVGEVIEDMDLDLSINDLQKHVSLTPIVPSNVLEVAERAMLENIDYTYYPTSFRLSVDTGALKLSTEQGLSMLTNLVDTFREDFERKYVNRSVLLDFTAEDLDRYDYIEAYEILMSQVELINNAVSQVMPEAVGFTSSQTGVSFKDVQVRLSLLETIELSNMGSRINNYLLSKDHDLLITIYEYRVEQLELDLARSESIELELNTLIDTYKGGTSTIIIPGMDSQEIDTEPYLNTLYAKLVDTQVEIAEYEKDIEYFNIRISRLKGEDPNFIVTPEKVASETTRVETSILTSATVLSEIAEDTEQILTEYNLYVSRGLIRSLVPPQYDHGTSILIYAAIGLVLGGMIGLGAVFTIDYKVKNKKEQ